MKVPAESGPVCLSVPERTGTPDASPDALGVLPNRWHDQVDEEGDGGPSKGAYEGVVNGEDRILIHEMAGTCSDIHSHRIELDTTSSASVCRRLQTNGSRRSWTVADKYDLALAVRESEGCSMVGPDDAQEAAEVETAA